MQVWGKDWETGVDEVPFGNPAGPPGPRETRFLERSLASSGVMLGSARRRGSCWKDTAARVWGREDGGTELTLCEKKVATLQSDCHF